MLLRPREGWWLGAVLTEGSGGWEVGEDRLLAVGRELEKGHRGKEGNSSRDVLMSRLENWARGSGVYKPSVRATERFVSDACVRVCVVMG